MDFSQHIPFHEFIGFVGVLPIHGPLSCTSVVCTVVLVVVLRPCLIYGLSSAKSHWCARWYVIFWCDIVPIQGLHYRALFLCHNSFDAAMISFNYSIARGNLCTAKTDVDSHSSKNSLNNGMQCHCWWVFQQESLIWEIGLLNGQLRWLNPVNAVVAK